MVVLVFVLSRIARNSAGHIFNRCNSEWRLQNIHCALFHSLSLSFSLSLPDSPCKVELSNVNKKQAGKKLLGEICVHSVVCVCLYGGLSMRVFVRMGMYVCI